MDEFIRRGSAITAVIGARLPDKTEDGVPIVNGKRSVSDCVRRLREIPAADVRPVVRGRWNVGADGWECSNCTIESNNTYPICPYCGAEMEES